MGTRLKLQSKLEELLGSDQVYYQPPESVKMEYPAIVYSKIGISSKYADNIKYSNKTRYSVIVIDRLPDNEVVNKLLELPYSSYDRSYTSDNFNHDVLTIYY